MDIEVELNGKKEEGEEKDSHGMAKYIQDIIESDEFSEFISNVDEGTQKKIKDVLEMMMAFSEQKRDGKERDREIYGKPQMKNKMKGNIDIGEGKEDLGDYVMVVKKQKMLFPKNNMMMKD